MSYCDFNCENCPSYDECRNKYSEYDLQEIRTHTIRTEEEMNEMLRRLDEEKWSK